MDGEQHRQGRSVSRLQVAGVHDVPEARMMAEAGVPWIGIPLRLPVNREDVTDAGAAEIVDACAKWSVTCVLITYLSKAADVLDLAAEIGVRHVQLHGPIETAELQRLRARRPELFLIKSLVVRHTNETRLLEDLELYSPHVDAFITDTYDPRTGASGATGLTHDWNVSRHLVLVSRRPVILAGGLHPGNVAAAIHRVRPAGVDVHTGVEGEDGRKTPEKLRAFAAGIRKGYASLESTAG